MPSSRTHSVISMAFLGESGREVQKLMDSTAGKRGPAHRGDHVHSVGGVALELVKQGRLTPTSMGHAVLHLAADELFDRVGKTLPPGTPRAIGKLLLEDALQRTFARRR